MSITNISTQRLDGSPWVATYVKRHYFALQEHEQVRDF